MIQHVMNTPSIAQPDVASTEREVFRDRLLSQMLLIERYRYQQQTEYGRQLSRNEAAREWIALFAADFPPLSE